MPLNLSDICIEPLNDLHRRGVFCCADKGIENFCRGHLAHHNRIELIKAYVAKYNNNRDVLGFYYLLNTSVEPDLLGTAGEMAEMVFHPKIPAVYLGMIGVHEPIMRQGLGTQLMLHAFRQVVTVAKLSGVWALTLDAIDEHAVEYYERFDFRRYGPEREMYLPLSVIRTYLDEIEDDA